MKNNFISLLTILLSFSVFSQTLKVPVKSPLTTVKQGFGISDVTLEYSRPSISNRTIFGDVVPFGELWRTGANACTKLTFADEVIINDTKIPAGTYSLLTIPERENWQIILNKNTNLWGTGGYSQDQDVIRFKARVAKSIEKVESFTIHFTDVKETSMNIELVWENTKVSFLVKVEVDDKVMESIKGVMMKDKRPFHQAAAYYYDNKKDMKQALEWATKAVELNPKAYWSYLLKAKIELELKDLKAAKASAEMCQKLAKEDEDGAYVKQATELLEKIGKTK
jgi:tetratricopeptide (TPR) repeat protein